MKAKKNFPQSKTCEHCNGRGSVNGSRPVVPCKYCGHDVHFEHFKMNGYKEIIITCQIDGCSCMHTFTDDSKPVWEWPHP